MSGFAREWLALRAPADAAARSTALARGFAAALPAAPHVIDLGAGDGANRRWLSAHLPAATRWTLIDNDAALLDSVADGRCLDLARALERVGEGDGVTCSALLDLVSASWLDRLAAWLDGRPFLAALTVDGRVRFAPEDAADGAVLAAFAADQRRDKGFGAALGPAAAHHAAMCLRDRGYRVATAPSDWMLGPGDRAMLEAMVEGFAALAPAAQRWAERRREQIAAGRLRLLVGHLDLLAAR